MPTKAELEEELKRLTEIKEAQEQREVEARALQDRQAKEDEEKWTQ
jgi:hypothetical protein